jgi:lipoic acid synthetase
VKTGWPGSLDAGEPFRLARTVADMGLRYTVVTSVDRDDLPDSGAGMFALSISEIRRIAPTCKVEVLIPDFSGDRDALAAVVKAGPEVLNHNIETARRVFPKVRPKGDYDLSLELLRRVKEIDSSMPVKSGMMVGLGETRDEILETMRDLRRANCDLLTIGQYLRPSRKHVALAKWYTPDEFAELKREAEDLGFQHVASGPLVRSSYHADEQHATATAVAV